MWSRFVGNYWEFMSLIMRVVSLGRVPKLLLKLDPILECKGIWQRLPQQRKMLLA